MSRNLVIHIFHSDESSLNTSAHVAERIRQVMGEQGLSLEVFVFGPAEKALTMPEGAEPQRSNRSLGSDHAMSPHAPPPGRPAIHRSYGA
jgi:hypothetical protein